ncbi:MAG: OmpH family outer membrane protein [Muribaculaceae bacterium]|nr:OmpH family outer membrane protein [Muribaculaceae bacterium]MBO7382196.1 OmpH family outer membrane protein [Muribaculaceae bacterium]MBP5315864.1 OmpH family outer membrane protein [Muribaculaceae bacterium]MBR5436681.1 OmpH family outer membrane protein [Muribaculaceae bacterium]MBR5744157.1 OmpH family outer membrane protein [Muribaculaceae bacterium]
MIKKILLAAIIALPTCAFAQKFGVVDADAIMQSMPETAELQKVLTSDSQKYEAEFKNLQDEFEKKYAEYNKLKEDASQPQSIKERREAELQDLSNKIQEFRNNAMQQLQKKQTEMMQPIQQKVLTAIKSVGQKKGLTFILQNEIPVYVGTDVEDVTPAVKAELGIK